VHGEWPVFCATLLNVADVLSGRAGHPADWLYAGLIWSNNALTESPVKGMSSHTIDLVVSANLFFSSWVWVGECFCSYRPTTQVVPDKRPLNSCVCVVFVRSVVVVVDLVEVRSSLSTAKPHSCRCM